MGKSLHFFMLSFPHQKRKHEYAHFAGLMLNLIHGSTVMEHSAVDGTE